MFTHLIPRSTSGIPANMCSDSNSLLASLRNPFSLLAALISTSDSCKCGFSASSISPWFPWGTCTAFKSHAKATNYFNPVRSNRSMFPTPSPNRWFQQIQTTILFKDWIFDERYASRLPTVVSTKHGKELTSIAVLCCCSLLLPSSPRNPWSMNFRSSSCSSRSIVSFSNCSLNEKLYIFPRVSWTCIN